MSEEMPNDANNIKGDMASYKSPATNLPSDTIERYGSANTDTSGKEVPTDAKLDGFKGPDDSTPPPAPANANAKAMPSEEESGIRTEHQDLPGQMYAPETRTMTPMEQQQPKRFN